jgi:Concanavalin A-like lectin/glucanases superfamily
MSIGFFTGRHVWIAITALASCLLHADPVGAQSWSTDPTVNNAIAVVVRDQRNPAITSDGAGGAIIAWESRNALNNNDVYAQRIGADGLVKWTPNGVPISAAILDQNRPSIASDGAGGAYITWQDHRNGINNSDIYAQHVDAAGVSLWTLNGIPVAAAPGRQQSPIVINDGVGGALITWDDSRNGQADIYAQRIDATGSIHPGWIPNGVKLSNGPEHDLLPVLVSDGAGGAIVAWVSSQFFPFNRIRAQHIAGNGAVLWSPAGVPLTTLFNVDQVMPTIAGDGAGGAVVVWIDLREGVDYRVIAQRIDPAGAVQWGSDGLMLANVPGFSQFHPAVVSDGTGGAIVVWSDDRGAGLGYDIYAQRVSPAGALLWSTGGAVVSAAAGDQQRPSLVSDGAGGAIVTWEDGRSTLSPIWDIYAQRIDESGAAAWATNGLALATAASTQEFRDSYDAQYRPAIVRGDNGCVIITWADFRNGIDGDVYAQLVNGAGTLGGSCAPCVVPPSGMVAWWRFNEGAGAMSFQEAFGLNHAAPLASPVNGVQAPQAVPGVVAGAVNFPKFGNNLSGAEVKPQGELHLIGTGSFTIDAWVKVPPAHQGAHYIVDRFDPAEKKGYALYVTSAGNERLEFVWGDGAIVQSVQTSSVLTTGTWHHVAVTFARDIGTVDIRLYVDGTLQGQQLVASPVGSLVSVTFFRFLQIGRQPGSLDEPITIDELEFFKVALTAKAVKLLYDAGSAGKCDCTTGGQSVDLTALSGGSVFGVGPGGFATVSSPLTINYFIQGCLEKEIFLIAAAPAVGLPLSYFDGNTFSWIPVPTPTSLIQPFLTTGSFTSDGPHALYSGGLPAGTYTLFMFCDQVPNGHLDIAGECLHGAVDSLILNVQ